MISARRLVGSTYDLSVGHLVLVGGLSMANTRDHNKFGAGLSAFSHRSCGESVFWSAARAMALEVEDESWGSSGRGDCSEALD